MTRRILAVMHVTIPFAALIANPAVRKKSFDRNIRIVRGARLP